MKRNAARATAVRKINPRVKFRKGYTIEEVNGGVSRPAPFAGVGKLPGGQAGRPRAARSSLYPTGGAGRGVTGHNRQY